MARQRRRKRRHEDAPRPTSPMDTGEEPVSQDPDSIEESEKDHSCLVHPGYNLSMRCDRCDADMCTVCAMTLREQMICADCLHDHVRHKTRPGGGWRGPASLALGLVALSVVTAPLAFAMTPETIKTFPGGTGFFIYGPILMGAIGVVMGFSAQDFQGITRRAGWVGIVISFLALGYIFLLNLSRTI